MSTIKFSWAGRIYGTNTGNVFVEYTQTDDSLIGIARFNDDKLGVAIYEISGKNIDGKIEIKGKPRQPPAGVVLGDATITAELKQDGSLAGNWETTIGTGGIIKLFPHSNEDKPTNPNEPEQIYNKSIHIGSVRIFKKDLQGLFQLIEKDFFQGKLVVTYVQRESEVTRFAPDFLKDIDNLKEIRSLKIFIQEQEAPGINKTVSVEFYENSENTIRVSGINESWVVGKAESIKKQIENYEYRLLTNYKKYGLNLNTILFFIVLGVVPDISNLLNRLIFLATVLVLLVILYRTHSKLLPNTIIISGDTRPNYFSRNWPTIASWLSGIAATVISGYLLWFLKK